MTGAPRTPAPADRPAVLHAAALRGDQQAWEQLVTPHLSCVRAVAHGWLRDADAHAVDDVVQEVLLRAWTRLEQLEDPERVGAWMAATTRSVALDRLRHGQRASALATLVQQLRDPAHVVLPDEAVLADEEATVLLAHLRELSERDARALWRRDALGAPVGEVARDLGLTEGSTRVLLHRARTRLRAAYAAVAVPTAGLALRLRERVEALDAPGALLPTAAVVAAGVAGVAVLPVGAPSPPPPPVAVVAPAPAPEPRPAPATRLPEPGVVEPVRAEPPVEPTPAATVEDVPAPPPPPASPAPRRRPLVSDEPPQGAEPDVTVGGDAEDPEQRPGVEVFVSDLLDDGCDGSPLAGLVGCDAPGAG